MQQLEFILTPSGRIGAQYRIQITPPREEELFDYPPPYRYSITDGLNGPVIKQGCSRSIRGWMGAYGAAEKAITRLMRKEIQNA